LWPLAAPQRAAAARALGREPVCPGVPPRAAGRRAPADAHAADPTAPGAGGVASTVAPSGQAPSGQPPPGHERRRGVRARACAASQATRVRRRVARAGTESNALDARQPGHTCWPDEAAGRATPAALRANPRVAGWGTGDVTTATHAHGTRREGARPARTGRRARRRVPAASAAAAGAPAVRRRGWRVYATQHTAEPLSLAQGGAASRRASLREEGVGRLKGRAWSLAPVLRHDAHRSVGRSCLRTIARRVLVLRPDVVRRTLAHQGATRTGISPGQCGRQTTRPTPAMRLRTFRGLTLSPVTINDPTCDPVTPRNDGQQRILAWREFPRAICSKIATQFSNTDFHSHEM
jgi:hypothetical protein